MTDTTCPVRGTFKGPLSKAWGSRAAAGPLAPLLENSRTRLTLAAFALQSREGRGNLWEDVLRTDKFKPLVTAADQDLRQPWAQPLAADFARYFQDGDRRAYESQVEARQSRLSRAVAMALATENEQVRSQTWLDEVANGAMLLCEQSSWCWGAHEDVHTRQGFVLPNVTRPFLDLGAGEVVAQLGWLDLLLGERLAARFPGLRERIRHEAMARVITPFLDRDDWHWLGLDGHVHNWNPWIHSNVVIAALTLIDDDSLKARVVASAIEGLDRFLASLPADGAIDEGFAYWWNGACRALEALDLLEQASGGVLAFDAIPVVHATLDFPHRMHLGSDWYVNVADGPARAHNGLPWSMVASWAERLDHPDAASHARAQLGEPARNTQYLGRVLHALSHEVHAAAEDPTRGNAAPDPGCYLPSVQLMVARDPAPAGSGLTLSAKGGHNGENHNHNDVGSVIVAVDGTPVLVDAGQPTYTAETFGPRRYEERCMQSLWHSTPAPFGRGQLAGPHYGAAVVAAPDAVPDAVPGTLALEIAGAYGLPEGSRWTRTSTLDRDRGEIVVTDDWSLPPGSGPGSKGHEINFLAAGSVAVDHEAGTLRITPGPGNARTGTGSAPERGLQLRWEPAAAVVHLDDWELADPLLQASWGERLTRIRFSIASETAEGSFTTTMEAVA